MFGASLRWLFSRQGLVDAQHAPITPGRQGTSDFACFYGTVPGSLGGARGGRTRRRQLHTTIPIVPSLAVAMELEGTTIHVDVVIDPRRLSVGFCDESLRVFECDRHV